MEFNLIPTIQEDGSLKTNAAELVTSIREGLAPYNYLVDKDNYQQAKTDRALLNKAVDQISNSRKLMEEKVFGTWKTDKALIMQIEKEIKAKSDALGAGIRQIDDEEKQAKADKLQANFNTLGGQKYDFSKVLAEHKSWLNRTAKDGTVFMEMEKTVKSLKALEAQIEKGVEDLKPDQQILVLNGWYDRMDFEEALAEIQQLREINRNLAAMERQEAEAREIRQAVEPDPEPVQVEEAHYPQAKKIVSEKTDKIYRRAFLIEGTEPQLRALVSCLKEQGIRILDIIKDGTHSRFPEEMRGR